MNMDFTFNKYQKLCKSISNSDYQTLTMNEYFTSKKKPHKHILIRHDVDSEPNYALKMAKLENELNISSTYYFRHMEGLFLPELMENIASLGHEIGYHYEVLDKAFGNYELAINMFAKELSDFRNVCDIKTIAQHGSPLLGSVSATSVTGVYEIIKNIILNKNIFTKWVNVDLWKKYDLKDFGILGEAYVSFDFSKIEYLSDSGRSWNPTKYKFRDTVSVNSNLNIINTDDIIDIINYEQVDALYLLIHSNQWKESIGEWMKWLFFQYIRNTGKILLKHKRGQSNY